jgi:hypothetical protein
VEIVAYNIQELVNNANTATLKTMIPILIGKSKSLYKESLNFIDINKTQLQLTNINNSSIDETSLLVNIKSWNSEYGQFSISNSITNTKEINLSITTTNRLPNNSLFVIIDTNQNILFSSTIDNFIYQQSDLIKILITNPLNLTGILDCHIINLETKQLTGNFDSLLNILTIDTNFIFKTPSFKYIYDISNIEYIGSSRDYYVNYISNITQDNIDAEKNSSIKSGLILNQSAVVISYPNDTYITDLLEDLEKLNVGYYIVPVNVDLISNIISYINKEEKFFNILISSNVLETKKIVFNQSFTSLGNYLTAGYITPGYVL